MFNISRVLIVSVVLFPAAWHTADKAAGQAANKIDRNSRSGSQKTFVNKIGMTMVRMPAGTFKMGSTKQEQEAVLKSVPGKFAKYTRDWLDTEGPQHEVRISRDFYMGAYPVTVGHFGQFVDETGNKTDADGTAKAAGATTPRENGTKASRNTVARDRLASDQAAPGGQCKS